MKHVVPKGSVQIALDSTGHPATRPSPLQHKRTAGEIAGAYEIVEQPCEDAQGLTSAALGQWSREQAPMLTTTGQTVVAPSGGRMAEKCFVGDHILAGEARHRLATYLRGPEQQPFCLLAVAAKGMGRVVIFRQPQADRRHVVIGRNLSGHVRRSTVGSGASRQDRRQGLGYGEAQRMFSHAFRCPMPRDHQRTAELLSIIGIIITFLI
ncbi:hypothetical protein RHOFW104R3_01745 [Rhodanobacter denitrificans]|nr:hypothetical protein RHOFW104R3_01745 [Rhodanobacter denitrificans]